MLHVLHVLLLPWCGAPLHLPSQRSILRIPVRSAGAASSSLGVRWGEAEFWEMLSLLFSPCFLRSFFFNKFILSLKQRQFPNRGAVRRRSLHGVHPAGCWAHSTHRPWRTSQCDSMSEPCCLQRVRLPRQQEVCSACLCHTRGADLLPSFCWDSKERGTEEPSWPQNCTPLTIT